jgi:hypothetical protein
LAITENTPLEYGSMMPLAVTRHVACRWFIFLVLWLHCLVKTAQRVAQQQSGVVPPHSKRTGLQNLGLHPIAARLRFYLPKCESFR